MRQHRVDSQVMVKKPTNQKRVTAELVSAETFLKLSEVEREVFREMGPDGEAMPSLESMQRLRTAFLAKEKAIQLLVEAELEDEAIARNARTLQKMRPTQQVVVQRDSIDDAPITEFAKPIEQLPAAATL